PVFPGNPVGLPTGASTERRSRLGQVGYPGGFVAKNRRVEVATEARVDRLDQLSMAGEVLDAVLRAQPGALEGVFEEVEQREVEAVQKGVATEVRDAPMQ